MQHASSRRSKQPRFLSRNPHYHSSSSRHQVTARAGFNFRPFLAGELTRAVTRRGALRWLLCETGHQRPLPSSPRQGSEERRERQCPRQGRARDGDYADPHTSEESPRIMSRRRGRRARRPAPSRILQRTMAPTQPEPAESSKGNAVPSGTDSPSSPAFGGPHCWRTVASLTRALA